MKKLILAVSVIALLGGCSSRHQDVKVKEDLITNEQYREMIFKEEKKLNDRLAKSALLAVESQKIMTETNNGLVRPKYDYDKIREVKKQINYVPSGMERILPYDWTGDAETAIESVLHYAGYEIEYKGTRPIQSRTVDLLPGQRTIKQHLDTIEIDTKGYIKDFFIEEQTKTVVVIYENF